MRGSFSLCRQVVPARPRAAPRPGRDVALRAEPRPWRGIPLSTARLSRPAVNPTRLAAGGRVAFLSFTASDGRSKRQIFEAAAGVKRRRHPGRAPPAARPGFLRVVRVRIFWRGTLAFRPRGRTHQVRQFQTVSPHRFLGRCAGRVAATLLKSRDRTVHIPCEASAAPRSTGCPVSLDPSSLLTLFHTHRELTIGQQNQGINHAGEIRVSKPAPPMPLSIGDRPFGGHRSLTPAYIRPACTTNPRKHVFEHPIKATGFVDRYGLRRVWFGKSAGPERRLSPVCRHASAVRMDASRRHADAARSTRSFNRNCPVPAEIAGNPPAVGSATPGVLRKNVSVTA